MTRIGRFKRMQLESIAPENLTPEQKVMLDEINGGNTEELLKLKQDYWSKVTIEAKNPMKTVNATDLFEAFRYYFEQNEQRKLILDSSVIHDISPIIYYFSRDLRFYDCKNLMISEPSMTEKGLMIVGGYGNGKTSVMKAMQMAVQGFDVPSFARYSANKVVELYELCDKAEKKSDFWIKMSTGHKLFDDVKTEREASNYGKVNVFKDVFEKRYESKAMTYITCNYQEDAPNDVEKAVNEFGAKYGARVWDRMYEMFNIIEFKGKSFRK